VELEFIKADVYQANAILKTLRAVTDRWPDCAVDITGGTDAVLYAAGLLGAEKPLPAFTYSRRKNRFYEIRNAAFAARPCEVVYSVEDCFRMAGGNNWIEGKPMRLTKQFEQDYGSVLNIAVSNNNWEQLHPMKATIRCHCDYALAVGRPIYFGTVNSVFYTTPMAAIDLNGYNQSVSRIYPAWTGYETVGGHNWAATYGLVTSATPATLEITGTETTVFPVKFEGAAGLHMNGTGSFTITNKLSNTTGELKVSKGTVRFARDAGWTAVTNIVLAGGTLAVASGAGAKAFGSAQDKSDAILTVVSTNSPTLSIAAGERPSVNMLAVVEEGGQLAWKNPGVYGGPAAGLSANNTLSWISGSGKLFVRRSALNGTMLILR
jgi:hypothetical protein